MGGILTFGAFLMVFGLSLLHNVEKSMKDGIIHSVAGHIQVYSKKAKDSLALFGSTFMGKEDLGNIDDFAELRKLLVEDPNVQEVVPMGFDMAMLGRGNDADDLFDSLRAALKNKDSSDIQEKIAGVRFYIANLKKEVLEQQKILSAQEHIEKSLNHIREVENEEFWKNFSIQDEEKLQFLETKIAPISGEKPFVYLRYLGTNPQLFTKTFDKFKIVSGEMIPEGRRGILLSHKFSEDFLKMNCARKFDSLHRKVKNGLKIADDPELKRFASQLALQHRPILMRLSKASSDALEKELTEYLKGDPNTSLLDMLKQFLAVDDTNFESRYEFFYKNIAPKLKLYEIAAGENIVLRSYTKTGYLKSVPLKVYGVYSFDGLEDSDIAGVFNIMDLVSFRELFGQMTEESLKETEQIKAAMNLKNVDSSNADDAFFGEDAVIETSQKEDKHVDVKPIRIESKKGITDSYDLESLQKGLLINAAVILKDGSKLEQTLKAMQARLSDKSLKIVDWKEASGTVGQFVDIIRYVLLFGIGIILLVALVIINNSFMVATFERSLEIGTMRALGAQKEFVAGLFFTEAVCLSLLASTFGSLIAYALLTWLHGVGIPAMHDVITFLFSGPRLYPTLELRFFIIGPVVVTLLAGISSLYPAWFAANIPPAQAMQEKE